MVSLQSPEELNCEPNRVCLCVRYSEWLPMSAVVSSFQQPDGLWQQVSRVSGAQQVQQNLLTIFVADDFVQRRQDLLYG